MGLTFCQLELPEALVHFELMRHPDPISLPLLDLRFSFSISLSLGFVKLDLLLGAKRRVGPHLIALVLFDLSQKIIFDRHDL